MNMIIVGFIQLKLVTKSAQTIHCIDINTLHVI